eukprot:scaffold33285_cov67-Cyclotella_meneghiniana.AAC.3
MRMRARMHEEIDRRWLWLKCEVVWLSGAGAITAAAQHPFSIGPPRKSREASGIRKKQVPEWAASAMRMRWLLSTDGHGAARISEETDCRRPWLKRQVDRLSVVGRSNHGHRTTPFWFGGVSPSEGSSAVQWSLGMLQRGSGKIVQPDALLTT